MGVSPKCKRVDFSSVCNSARSLKEGCGVLESESTGAEEDHTSGLGLYLSGQVQKDSRIVTLLWDHVNAMVVNLEDHILDLRIFANPEPCVCRQDQFWCVLGPGVQDLGALLARLVIIEAVFVLGHFATVPQRLFRSGLLAAINLCYTRC
jgi:hypothetical protein